MKGKKNESIRQFLEREDLSKKLSIFELAEFKNNNGELFLVVDDDIAVYADLLV